MTTTDTTNLENLTFRNVIDVLQHPFFVEYFEQLEKNDQVLLFEAIKRVFEDSIDQIPLLLPKMPMLLSDYGLVFERLQEQISMPQRLLVKYVNALVDELVKNQLFLRTSRPEVIVNLINPYDFDTTKKSLYVSAFVDACVFDTSVFNKITYPGTFLNTLFELNSEAHSRFLDIFISYIANPDNDISWMKDPGNIVQHLIDIERVDLAFAYADRCIDDLLSFPRLQIEKLNTTVNSMITVDDQCWKKLRGKLDLAIASQLDPYYDSPLSLNRFLSLSLRDFTPNTKN
jgi:hypothetical protein